MSKNRFRTSASSSSRFHPHSTRTSHDPTSYIHELRIYFQNWYTPPSIYLLELIPHQLLLQMMFTHLQSSVCHHTHWWDKYLSKPRGLVCYTTARVISNANHLCSVFWEKNAGVIKLSIMSISHNTRTRFTVSPTYKYSVRSSFLMLILRPFWITAAIRSRWKECAGFELYWDFRVITGLI